MKKVWKLSVCLFLLVTVFGCSQQTHSRDAIYQTSTLNALMEGVYDGTMTFGELRENGDFGIGTFNGLEGEMVELDGKFYQIKSDGKVYPVSPRTTTPFADVKYFTPDCRAELAGIGNMAELQKAIDKNISSKNIFYAFRITGTFTLVKARSIPKQSKPYPGLAAAAKQQVVFTFRNVRGTVIGYRMPGYVQGINMPGYHFHFLTEDRQGGGHVLECGLEKARLEIDECYELRLSLPKQGSFSNADLTKDRRRDLEKVESK
jgi:acetolactate decarboxylase